MKSKTIFLLIVFLSSLLSCIEKNIKDPIEVYKRWAGHEPPNDVQILHTDYWESPHWTKEYLLYMELQTTATWRREFVQQNKLKYDSTANFPINSMPKWFSPTANFKTLVKPKSNSIYSIDTVNNRIFIYEEKL